MSGLKERKSTQYVIVNGIRVATTLVVFALFGIPGMSSAVAPDDDAASVYSNRTVQGRWGFGGGGHGVAIADLAPAAGVGTMTFDGKGSCMVTSTINANGALLGPITSQECTYVVNPDGTGWSEASFGSAEFPDPVRILFVIVDRGRELFIINVDLFVAGYSAKRM